MLFGIIANSCEWMLGGRPLRQGVRRFRAEWYLSPQWRGNPRITACFRRRSGRKSLRETQRTPSSGACRRIVSLRDLVSTFWWVMPCRSRHFESRVRYHSESGRRNAIVRDSRKISPAVPSFIQWDGIFPSTPARVFRPVAITSMSLTTAAAVR